MNSKEGDFVNARRRYRALLRERNRLEAEGTVDHEVSTELAKLEVQFPELNPEAPRPASTPADAGADASAELGSPKESLTSAPPSLSAADPDAGGVRVTSVRRTASNLPALVITTDPRHAATALSGGKTGKRPHRTYAMSIFALQVYNEANRRSVFGPLNFLKLGVLAVANAGFHVFVDGPCSMVGSQISPSLFCTVMHVYNLYPLFVKRPARVSFPMLLVYVTFDFFPSMLSIFVVHRFAVSFLSLLFSRPVSFQC